MKWEWELFRGPTGKFDTARIVFAIGGIGVAVGPLVFQGWALYKGQTWDPAGFCGGYGGGLAAYLTGGGFGIAAKDKGVASALNTTPPSPPAGGQP